MSVLRLLVRLAMQEEQDSSNETASRARYSTKLRLVARRRPFSKGQAWCNHQPAGSGVVVLADGDVGTVLTRSFAGKTMVSHCIH